MNCCAVFCIFISRDTNVMDEELNRTAAHDAISAAEEVVSWSRKQLRT